MNHYKWIVIQIQDMSTGDFVHSVRYMEDYEDQSYQLSLNPLQYYVKSDDMEGLLAAKEIMTAAMNSIYEVITMTDEYITDSVGDEIAVLKPTPAYLDNFIYYNMRVKEAKVVKDNKGKAGQEYLKLKKLHKNRFQLIENFTSHVREEIELYEEESA